MVDEASGANSWLINTLPAVGKQLSACTLGDLKVVSPEGGLSGYLSVDLITFTDAGQYDNRYVYLDDVTCQDYSCEPGWYTEESIENWDPVSAAEVVITSGRMFNILSDCGATITIPSALE